ncbi:MAG: hypothetical protein ABIY71_07290, partial [Flavobacteriales bacterium]
TRSDGFRFAPMPRVRTSLPKVFPAKQAWRSGTNSRGDLWVLHDASSVLIREVFGLHPFSSSTVSIRFSSSLLWCDRPRSCPTMNE